MSDVETGPLLSSEPSRPISPADSQSSAEPDLPIIQRNRQTLAHQLIRVWIPQPRHRLLGVSGEVEAELLWSVLVRLDHLLRQLGLNDETRNLVLQAGAVESGTTQDDCIQRLLLGRPHW